MANTVDDYEYVDENSIPEDLCCPICMRPFIDPICLQECGHTYCQQCIRVHIARIPRCPMCQLPTSSTDIVPVKTRPFINQLNQLLVKCSICSNSKIQRLDLRKHQIQCSELIPCPAANLKCPWRGSAADLKNHIEQCALTQIQPLFKQLEAKFNLKIQQQTEDIRKLNVVIQDQAKCIREQTEQMRFMSKILQMTSKNMKARCQETYRDNRAYCDNCNSRYALQEHMNSLHYCPNTDFCETCAKKLNLINS